MSASADPPAVEAPQAADAVSPRLPGDDTALLSAAQDGSSDAVEALVRRHWGAAHRAAYLVVQDAAAAEDIAQESMLAAVRAIHDFDRRRPFGPWLHRIVVNRAIDWVRTRRRRAEVSSETVGQLERSASPEGAIPLSDELVAALGTLDPEDRAVVVLRHLLDYSASEIARMLGVPPATVRTRLRRALDRVRPLLEAQQGGTS